MDQEVHLRPELDLLPKTDLGCTTLESGRTYHTPDGDFPSVTTVIGRSYDHSWLDEWRERVGEDEVRRVSGLAQRRGTGVHACLENWALGLPYDPVSPVIRMNVRSVVPVLEENVETIYGVEYALWNRYLRTAGRADMLARWGSRNTIVDFKTAKERRSEKDIMGYFVQTSCYAMMATARTGMEFDQLAVIMAVDGMRRPQVFVKDVCDYADEVLRIFVRERREP